MVEELFGTDGITSKAGGKVSPKEAFDKAKIVGIYFSMHTCPPCRQFTPIFAELYKEMHDSGNTDLAVIFCSGDKTEELYNEYYEEQPWHALPFKDPRLAQLAKKFEVRGVPRLIIVNRATGEVIDQNGVQKVTMEGPAAIEEYIAKASK